VWARLISISASTLALLGVDLLDTKAPVADLITTAGLGGIAEDLAGAIVGTLVREAMVIAGGPVDEVAAEVVLCPHTAPPVCIRITAAVGSALVDSSLGSRGGQDGGKEC